MFVSKANDQPDPHQPLHERDQTWYAPLYISTTLRDFFFDIEELERLALDRLRLLKAVTLAHETAGEANWRRDAILASRHTARLAERQYNLKVSGTGEHRSKLVLNDEASHFILRLALCHDHDQRQWVLNSECALFAARLEGAPSALVLDALRHCGGPRVHPVTRAELDADKGSLRRELDEVMRGAWRHRGETPRFFKVAFEHVPALVRARRCLMRKGDAYVPQSCIHDVLSTLFRAKLSQALTHASRAAALADGDRRMGPILKSVRAHHVASVKTAQRFDGAATADRISLDELNEARVAMPLCMQNMMARLRETHHLRHAARMQLGVFLMGCGLTMDESLRFWRTEFGRGAIDSSKFEKTYAYNIRHYHGKEGKRQVLKPKDCMKIITERPGPGEYNGCPYREFQENTLAAAIRGMGVDPENVKLITGKAKEGHFQTACGMCFKATQPPDDTAEPTANSAISHPNEYFIEARRRRFKQRKASRPPVDEPDEDMPPLNPDESQAETQPTPTKPSEDASAADETTPADTQPSADVVQPMLVESSEPATQGSNDHEEQESKRQCTEPEPVSN